jgi:hypothetical protein
LQSIALPDAQQDIEKSHAGNRRKNNSSRLIPISEITIFSLRRLNSGRLRRGGGFHGSWGGRIARVEEHDASTQFSCPILP